MICNRGIRKGSTRPTQSYSHSPTTRSAGNPSERVAGHDPSQEHHFLDEWLLPHPQCPATMMPVNRVRKEARPHWNDPHKLLSILDSLSARTGADVVELRKELIGRLLEIIEPTFPFPVTTRRRGTARCGPTPGPTWGCCGCWTIRWERLPSYQVRIPLLESAQPKDFLLAEE